VEVFCDVAIMGDYIWSIKATPVITTNNVKVQTILKSNNRSFLIRFVKYLFLIFM